MATIEDRLQRIEDRQALSDPLDCVRTPDGWKIARVSEVPLMPLPESLTDIHGRD